MKRLLPLAALLLFAASCRNTWNEDDKKVFYDACLENAKTSWPQAAPSGDSVYCNCVFEKIAKKYPVENDALDHINDIMKDPEMQQCKTAIMKQP